MLLLLLLLLLGRWPYRQSFAPITCRCIQLIVATTAALKGAMSSVLWTTQEYSSRMLPTYKLRKTITSLTMGGLPGSLI